MGKKIILQGLGVISRKWFHWCNIKEPSGNFHRESIPFPFPASKSDAEAETQILWLPDVKNHLVGKDPDAGKD